MLLRDGGVIAPGFDATLDELRGIGANCDAYLLDLERASASAPASPTCASQFNKVHGFTSRSRAPTLDRVPDDHLRRQTLKNAERFITPELRPSRTRRCRRRSGALAREAAHEQVLDQLQTHPGAAHRAGARPGQPGRTGGARRARTHRWSWCRPSFVKEPCIDIEGGRHPVVEARLAETGAGNFMANDCRLDANRRMLVITGPNMGGKSTFMRRWR